MSEQQKFGTRVSIDRLSSPLVERLGSTWLFSTTLFLSFSSCTSSAWSDSVAENPSLLSAPINLAQKVSNRGVQPRLDRFQLAIKMFEWKDRRQPPPDGATVFVGSSTFTKWRNLEETFKEFGAINRGFGGSTIPEVNHYVSLIVTKYKPKKVVFYCGSNDIADLHHDGQQVFDDFKTFVKLVHNELPTCQIYFISESVPPSRESLAGEFAICNALVQAYISSTPNVHYINVLPVMRDQSGKLRADLFGPDRLHMTPEGYALWAQIIKTGLGSGK